MKSGGIQRTSGMPAENRLKGCVCFNSTMESLWDKLSSPKNNVIKMHAIMLQIKNLKRTLEMRKQIRETSKRDMVAIMNNLSSH